MSVAAAEARLDEVIASTWPMLLDFDGPITPLFADGRNVRLADRMRTALIEADVRLPDEISHTVDPLAVLRWSALRQPAQLADRIERTCTAGEIELAQEAAPTAGAHDLLGACQAVGRPVVIVSNNAPETIRAYLDRHHLAGQVLEVIGRRHGQPELMKPHPDAISRALTVLREPARRCAFLGDSVTDVEVANTTGVRSIGYAKHARRGEELAAAGADALTADLALISQSISAGRHATLH